LKLYLTNATLKIYFLLGACTHLAAVAANVKLPLTSGCTFFYFLLAQRCAAGLRANSMLF
jgi:hypothetical protein